MEVARLSEDEARAMFRTLRFSDTDGKPVCPHCACDAVVEFRCRPIFKCKGCERQFSLTSGTIFASRKLYFAEILVAMAIFVNGANGVSALRLSREIMRSYKTAFVLAHKLREAMGTMKVDRMLTGTVEIDGVWVGGHIKKANEAAGRKDMRVSNPKRASVVVMRERRPGGRTLTFKVKHEKDAVEAVLEHVDPSASIRTDEASHWIRLHAYFDDVKTINHKQRYAEKGGVHTNWAESFNSRLRRAERGVHHRISGRYLDAYAQEFAWREDFRRVDNGRQFTSLLRSAGATAVSRRWAGYWQRLPDAAAA